MLSFFFIILSVSGTEVTSATVGGCVKFYSCKFAWCLFNPSELPPWDSDKLIWGFLYATESTSGGDSVGVRIWQRRHKGIN